MWDVPGLVAGVDEAGRGPLMGPVVAAAVILDDLHPIKGLADSKKLTALRREKLYDEIRAKALCFSIAQASAAEIDEINILQATWASMRRSINALAIVPDAVLVDGTPVPGLHSRCTSIVKGDDKSVSIAAASILAKVVRDSIMVDAHGTYPVYGFDGHKGYPSPVHLKALREHGPCPIHRRSYAPLAQAALDSGIH